MILIKDTEDSCESERMGEQRRKSLSARVILASENRCIYCENPPASLEHMPPRAMFRDKYRPSGLEFAACGPCNSGTSNADLVACFVAHCSPVDPKGEWEAEAFQRFIKHMRRKTPEVMREINNPTGATREWVMTPGGLLRQIHKMHFDGPTLRRHLDAFSSKLAMALYREHVGSPLPMEGAIYTKWYLNGGLA
ncbi:hypothetical protein FHW92_004125 [Novosphingobium sp. SG707]|nr:hypothetical protein [Novosphingobium sp. SG707]